MYDTNLYDRFSYEFDWMEERHHRLMVRIAIENQSSEISRLKATNAELLEAIKDCWDVINVNTPSVKQDLKYDQWIKTRDTVKKILNSNP